MRTNPVTAEDFVKNRLGFRGVLLALFLTALYFAAYTYLGTKLLHLLLGCLVFIAAFFLYPRPKSWLPVLPLLFALGAPTMPTDNFNPALATIIILVFTLFYLLDRVIWNRPLFVPSPYLGILLLAFALQTASVFISIHVHEQYAFNAIRDGSSVFIFAPLAVMIPVLCGSKDDVRRLHRAVVVAVAVVSLIGVVQYFGIEGFSRADLGIGYVYRGRIASVFGNPNIFAGYLELGLPPSIALFFLDRKIKWKAIALAAVIMGIMGVLFTFSRGGLLAAFVGIGLTLLYIYRRKIWVPVLMGITAVYLLLMSAGTFDRQMSFFLDPEQNMTQPTLLHRYVTYKGFLQQVREAPLTGVGYGAREHYWGRSRLYSFWEVRYVRSDQPILRFGGLNSLFLNNAVKGGLVSLASALLMFAAIYAAFFKVMRKGDDPGILATAITAGIFSFMVHQMVGNQIRFPTVNSLFWYNTGLLLTIVALAGRKDQKVASDT